MCIRGVVKGGDRGELSKKGSKIVKPLFSLFPLPLFHAKQELLSIFGGLVQVCKEDFQPLLSSTCDFLLPILSPHSVLPWQVTKEAVEVVEGMVKHVGIPSLSSLPSSTLSPLFSALSSLKFHKIPSVRDSLKSLLLIFPTPSILLLLLSSSSFLFTLIQISFFCYRRRGGGECEET